MMNIPVGKTRAVITFPGRGYSRDETGYIDGYKFDQYAPAGEDLTFAVFVKDSGQIVLVDIKNIRAIEIDSLVI